MLDRNFKQTENSEMNEAVTTGTALALPEPTALAAMFKTEGGLNALLARIERDAKAIVKDLDPTIRKDRELMKSAANKVSLSKAELDRQGKALTEVQRAEVKAANAARSATEVFLAKVRDEVRKPADDWEAAEAARIERIKLRLDAFRPSHVPASSDGMQALIAEIEVVAVDAGWMEFQTEAASAKTSCLARLGEHLKAAQEREAQAAEVLRQAAELEQLRREKAEREEADRLRAEAEAAEVARIEAERVEADRKRLAAERAEQDRFAAEKAEAERHAKIEAEKQEAARVASEQAGARAKAEAERLAKEAADREAELQRQIEAQKAETERAAQAERDRIAAEQKAADDARAKRESDLAHRAKIIADIAAALRSMAGAASPEQIATALVDGKIPHTKVSM